MGFDQGGIAEVDEVRRTIRMRRSTGRPTWYLNYRKIEEVYNLIQKNELNLDPTVGKLFNRIVEAFRYPVVAWGAR